MRLHELDLNLLVALDALIEERSVSLAAQRLHLSQSAMSGALARLRLALADELLDQQGRQMVLTPRAIELERHVKAILSRIETDVLTRREFDPATSDRSIAVMASDYATSVCLAPALQRIGRLAPLINFSVVPMAPDPFGQMDRGDIRLVLLPEAFASPKHRTRFVFRDRYVCVTWRRNRLVGDVATFEDLERLAHVSVQFDGSRSRSVTEWLEAAHGLRLRRAVTVASYNAAPFLLVGTERLAIMHSLLAAKYCRLLPLRQVALPVEIPPIVEVLQWQKVNDTDQGLAWVVDMIAKAATQIAA
jgi:DNA-binding transcriptional LysR family regulator